MTATEGLRDQAAAKVGWLERAVDVLEVDDAVRAVWLWGSEGRGDADELSDLDLFVAVADEPAHLAHVEERFSSFGDVVWSREVPYNAPRAGRYFSVGYTAPLVPLGVDWYWQPVSAAAIGNDTLVLIEKSPIERIDRATFQLFPNVEDHVPYRQPEDPVERLDGLLVWFWSMFATLGKQAARHQDALIVEQLPLLDGVLALAAHHVGRSASTTREVDALSRLQELADAMSDLHRGLADAGVTVPETSHALRWLELAATLRAEGWGPTTRS